MLCSSSSSYAPQTHTNSHEGPGTYGSWFIRGGKYCWAEAILCALIAIPPQTRAANCFHARGPTYGCGWQPGFFARRPTSKVNLKRFKFTLRKYSVPLGTGGKASNEFQLQATALEAIILVKEDRPPTRRRNVVESFNREPSAEFSSYLLRLLKQWTSGGVVDDEEVPC